MFTKKINEGDSVEILLVNQKAGIKSYASKIEAVDKTTVLIHSPFVKWDYVQLPMTELYWLNFIKSMFRYKASINKYISRNRLQLIKFKLLDEGERLQRRNFFRLSCYIPAKFTFLKKNESDQLISNEPHNGIICDLSGGGIKMTTKLEMEEKDCILISLPLDDNDLFLTGEIRVKYGNPNATHQFQYGIMFSDISVMDQNKIVRYLFEQQKHRIITNQ